MIKLSTSQRLSIVWLLFGMMFFYGIEQLFLNKYIKDSSARGYVTIAFVAALVIFDIPTGIIADRVSRKLCLLAACIIQIIAIIILGSSNKLYMYLIGSFVFGLFSCLINGAAQAILYDWLALKSKTKDYAKEQGRNYAALLIGAGIANIASGFIANNFGLRSNYYLSIIPAVLAFVLLIKLVDPPYAKSTNTFWYKHLNEVADNISKHRKILVYSAQFIAATIAFCTIGEFGQIYMLSFGISAVMLGVYWSIDAVFAASGRVLAYRIQNRPHLLILVFCLVIFIFSIIENRIGIGIFWLVYGLAETILNVAETEIQHETSSDVRATTLSLVSFVGYVIAIPITLFYTHYYVKHGIFAANKIIIWGLIIILIATVFVRPPKNISDISTKKISLPPAM